MQSISRKESCISYSSITIHWLFGSGEIAKQALAENRSVKDIILEKNLLKPEEIKKIFSRNNLLNEQ